MKQDGDDFGGRACGKGKGRFPNRADGEGRVAVVNAVMDSKILAMLPRRAFLGLALAILTVGPAAATRRPPPRLLFVCQFGSVKSAVAREWLRRRASERHILVAAQSRGLTPEMHVAPALAAALQADGINPGADPLRKFEAHDAATADVVILFDKAPGNAALAKARDWSDLGSMNSDYPAVRAELIRRIDRLLDEVRPR